MKIGTLTQSVLLDAYLMIYISVLVVFFRKEKGTEKSVTAILKMKR